MLRRTLLFSGLMLAAVFLFSSYVSADAITLPFAHDQGGIEHLPSVGVERVGNVSVGSGAQGLQEIVGTVGSLIAYILRAVALVALFIAGYTLVTAQGSISDEVNNQKMNLIYICIGLIGFALASEFVYQFLFFEEGTFLTNEQASIELAGRATTRIKELLNLFLSFSGAGAILMLVIASLRLVINPGSDDQIDQQKKLVGYTAVGIVIIGLADTMVNQVFFADGGYRGVNVSALEVQLQGLSNYILGFLGGIVLISFLVSGILMVINLGNDDINSKIKTTLRNIVIGALVAFSAYTVVATLIGTLLLAEGGV